MANVIVQGVFTVEPGEREAFIEASKAGMTASRAEAGCLEYVIAADPLEPGRVVLSERWESMDLLQVHLKGQASQPSSERARPLSVEITLYEVASSTKLV